MKFLPFVLSCLLVGVSSFGVQVRSVRQSSALREAIPDAEKSAEQKEIADIVDKWSTVRHLSKEEAEATLEPEWLEAYNRFYSKYDEDMEKMVNIAEKLQSMIEPPKVAKKTEGQRRRDKWAKVQAREAARAAAK